MVDVYLSNTRDDEAANAFFQQCFDTTCVLPAQITVDKERALANGIHHTFHGAVDIRDNKFMNNRLEQDHRGIKDWYRNMRGFKSIFAALVLCTLFEEFRQYFRMEGKTRAQRRCLSVPRLCPKVDILTLRKLKITTLVLPIMSHYLTSQAFL